jgi:oligopeptide transport system substrate-binding protein
MIRIFCFFALAATLAATSTGCTTGGDQAVAVSVIGPRAEIVDPAIRPLDAPARLLAGSLMQGLVSFDAAGQVEPALAERWIVTDDGLSTIFRIRRTRWANGKEVTAQQVVRALRAQIGPKSRNPLKSAFGNVREIVAMTDRVIEIRLSQPQPGLLSLLAQPDMAVIANRVGTGPYRIHKRNENSMVLRPALPDEATEEQTSEDLLRKSERHVRGEGAALAIARYGEGDVSLVLGGSFDDIALARAANLPSNVLRRDPASGLFGLSFARTAPKLGSVEVRRALAMAIDRQAMLNDFDVPGWRGTAAILPGPIESAADPALPEWVVLGRAERVQRARAAIIGVLGGEGKELVLRISLPAGPGGRLLFARIAADWQAVGVKLLRTGAKKEADVHLVDHVAPTGSAIWYFQQFGCGTGQLCSVDLDGLVQMAQREADPAKRAEAIAALDRAFAEQQLFIPLAAPLRWSLVAPRLQGYRENGFAVHPLNRLLRAR